MGADYYGSGRDWCCVLSGRECVLIGWAKGAGKEEVGIDMCVGLIADMIPCLYLLLQLGGTIA